MRAGWAAVVAVAATAGLVGCSQQSASPHEHDGAVTVVASTDVWGSVADAVVGDHASVTSIVNGTVADPHSFQATPADAAAITDASLVVYNGGHYDQWVQDVLANHPDVAAVDAYSLRPDPQGSANEHVFYDPATAKAVAAEIADRLAEADPDHADAYRANAATFGAGADEVLAIERAIAQAHPGAAVVATEPVAHYLLANAGITDNTPGGFTNAVEEDADPSPADLAMMLDLIEDREVSAVLFNPQTETGVTRQLREAATRAGVPVVTVTETLPEGTDYLSWQRQTAEQLAAQLDTAAKAGR
ncbi:zinc ABC transporter substrate-binding protein [Mycolicibacterium pulveris]|uniref:Putative ABC transporter solute binding protein n=1 Tax=Mycolicibacterium pulveris TaxID=36813 RepID=A0A7I7ULD3_MYCPV|nr:zinc ABC transporter substrate-binding protein [Mycolicibacterium pulveris]MCV6980286.1 zinc ABC transporter substrate-binding protein [Mycolicibacterium pulveris]BBY81673.1 putative ABC transporter solute binding protein [Mycolicibacterium pulveris]